MRFRTRRPGAAAHLIENAADSVIGPRSSLRRERRPLLGRDAADLGRELSPKGAAKVIVVATDRPGSIGHIGPKNGPSPMATVGTTSQLQEHSAINRLVEKRSR
jgi:hypothetical protein